MSSPAKDIADHLEGLSRGAFGTTIFASEYPETPDDCITIYDTGGGPNVYQDIELFEPTIQVLVRNVSYPAAYALIETIRDDLVLGFDFDINAHHYIGVWLQSDIISLGRDANNRYILTANFRMVRQPI